MRRWTEVAVALALSALVVVLSLRFGTHAGPLWRDGQVLHRRAR